MTRPDHARSNARTGEPETLRDDVLLDAAHSGDAEAFGVLRQRYHGTALAVARARTGSAAESEDIAAAALGRIEQVVGEGKGPRAFLGAFVVWMVGREVDGGTRPVALPDDPSDPASLLRVFSGLPAEWQAFLWHTEILGHSARRAAAARGFGTVAAAGLHRDVFRGLRGLYGQAAADRAAGPECAEFSGELAHFVRGTRGQRSRRDVKDHLDGCARCTAEYLGRQDIGTGLRTWTLPVLAGLPLWGTEALELAGLIAGADTGSGAVAGTAGAGAGAAGAAAAGATAEEAAGTSAWSGRRTKVLLGAGALATVVAVAAVGATGGGDPVPSAGGLAAEQAPRTAEDLEDSSAEDAAEDAERADGGESGAAERGREQGSALAGESAAGSAAEDGPAGALLAGAWPEGAAVLAGADGGRAAAAGAGDDSGSAPGSSGGDAAPRTGAAAERSAPGRGGERVAEADVPGTASTGGTSGDASPGNAPTGTAPSARQSSAPSPGAPVETSVPAVAASPAPLKASVPPVPTTAPPSAAERAGGQHAHRRGDVPRTGRDRHEPQHRQWSRSDDARSDSRSDSRKDTGPQVRGRDGGREGRAGGQDGKNRGHESKSWGQDGKDRGHESRSWGQDGKNRGAGNGGGRSDERR